jgi:hypothetical protein
MALSLWTQDNFTKGELSPLMYARISVKAYFDGVKLAKNAISFPQGGIGKRFGTEYLNEINSAVTDSDQIYFDTFQYLDECVYVIVVRPGAADIYLEGTLNYTVTLSGITAEDLFYLDSTVLKDRFRITNGRAIPFELYRSASAIVGITGFDAGDKTLTIASSYTVGTIYPFEFVTAVATTTPATSLKTTYYSKFITTNTIQIFKTPEDAKAGINAYEISGYTSGAAYSPQNQFIKQDLTFQNTPVFDFQDGINNATGSGNYNSINFAVNTMGPGAGTLTSSGTDSGIFTTAYIGGAYVQGPGVARITGYTSANVLVIEILKAFDVTSAVAGTFVYLAEPAWSTARGYPSKCSSFQNRAVFANSSGLPNGIWLSAINDFNEFSEIIVEDEASIAYYPTSGELNTIKYITPYRSLTIQTNNGFYSTPLGSDTALTPSNFSLNIQDLIPAGDARPTSIDNQIIIISGNDAYSMLWDGVNNSYTSKMISVMSEQVLTNPVKMAPFVDLESQGSRYLIVINEDGSAAIYQTMIEEEVSGWTSSYVEQSYGEAYFRHIASNFDGRAWFVVERQIGELDATGSITAINATETDTITGAALGLVIGDVIQVTFETTGTLPTTVPQIVVDLHYWAVGISSTEFAIYASKADAIADEDRVVISEIGVTSTVNTFPLSTKFFIEELDFDSGVDCAQKYNGVAASSITGVPRFNGQQTVSKGDSYGFESVGYNDSVFFTAHGESTEIEVAQTGFPINVAIQPMPLSIAMGSNSSTSNVVEPKHIRSVQFMFSNTVDGEVNGIPITLKTFEQTDFGRPPTPTTGTFQMSLMKGWNEFKYTSISVTHSSAFDIKLIGIFYKIEV